MSNDQRRFWSRFFLFAFMLFCLIQLFNYMPVQRSHRKNGNYWPYFYQELPKNSVDLIYMGNSHSKCTFIPEIIDDILGTQSVHVNTSGESIYQTIYEYREVLRYQNPKYVIIETFPIYDGLDQDDLKPWSLSFFYAMPLSFRKLVYSLDFINGNDLMDFLLPYTSNHSIWKKPDELFSHFIEEFELIKDKLKTGWRMDFPDGGYTNYLKSLMPGQIDLYAFKADDPCPIPDLKERLAATEKILQIDQEHQQDLLFIEAPQFINNYENCRPDVQALIESYGVTYKTLLDNQIQPLLWFGDKQHLTQFGAVIASVTTAEFLAEKLDVPVSTEALKYYKNYFFKDYTLDIEGTMATLTLVPYDGTSINDLNFMWEVFSNDISLFKSSEMGGNKIQYTFPESKSEYFIHVMINDPADNYYLRGGFTIAIP